VNKAADVAARGAALEGELKIVVIQALHADSPDPAYTADDLAQVYFTGPYVNGTLADFYDEVSGGRLAVTGDVADWVRTSLTREEVVGTNYGLGGSARTGEYLWEALDSVDAAIDFGEYDNDGPDGVPNSGDDDGVVDVVAFQFIEVSASCGGPGIWPHRSSLSSRTGSDYITNDLRSGGGAISVNGYTIQSVVDCSGITITTARTMAHELGHALGLPDYRHHVGGVEPQHRRWLLGCWALMSGGSWGCSDVDPADWVRPPHMTPIAKLELGWLGNVIDVTEAELHEFALQPVQTSEQVLRVPLQGSDEFFLVEFRDKIGFDLALPAAGVLVYHMEPGRNYPCSDCDRLYPFYLVEADGRGDLLRTALEGGNIGEASDVFGATGPASFTNHTTPATHLNIGAFSKVNFYRDVGDLRARLKP
jgi:M6 family metalloprotease-like protein